MTTQTKMFAQMRANLDKQRTELDKKKDALYLIKSMMRDYYDQNSRTFEAIYDLWLFSAALYGLKLPTEHDCELALNGKASSPENFILFFSNYFDIPG